MTSGFLQGFNEEEEVEKELRNSHRTALDADLYTDDSYAVSMAAGAALDRKAPATSASLFREIDNLIVANVKALRLRYPEGGIRAARPVTASVMRQAPEDYFDRFDEDVERGTSYVQNALVARGGSELVAQSQAYPTDEAMQDKAFSKVQALILEFLGKTAWSGLEKIIVAQLITNEIIGFSSIDPLWRDKSINEIAVDGPRNVRIEISGRWTYVKSCKFRTQSHMEQLLERLYNAVGKSLSRLNPKVKGRLHDQSRIFSVHRSAMPHGPSLNIRRHSEKHWTPEEMVARGTASAEVMTTIGNLIHKGCTYLVVGSTSTGKTTMLNALTGFYRDDVRILTIEDSLEMKPNPRKMLVPGMETIPARPETKDHGLNIRQLVEASLQMAPDVIIIGESTGGEAYDLCQAMNTGHAGASTLHASTPRDTIPRLLSLVGQGEVIQAEAALPLIGGAFDFIVFLEHSMVDGSRKILEVTEIPNYPDFDKSNKPYLKLRPIWRLDRETGEWNKVGDISQELKDKRALELEPDLSWEELKELSKA